LAHVHEPGAKVPVTGRFGAVLTAMATPFDQAGRVDLGGAAELARWLVAHGSDGLVVAGTTGESPVLSDDEKLSLWRAVAGAVDVPVLAGTSTPDTAHSVELSVAAAEIGLAGLLLVTPYYSRPSQAGIDQHVRSIAAAAGVPVLLYDIPVRTGRALDPKLILRLAEDGVVVGVKDATGSPSAAAALVAQAPSGFELYSGNDADTLPLLAVGAVGTVSVESHWAGPEVAELVAAVHKGDLEHARALNATLLASHRFQSSDAAPNPVPTKAMLRVLGLPGGSCRPPLGPEPPGLTDAAREVLAGLGRDVALPGGVEGGSVG
jgi:4-hydroxy-tetrahydrodipicolinate synthase